MVGRMARGGGSGDKATGWTAERASRAEALEQSSVFDGRGRDAEPGVSRERVREAHSEYLWLLEESHTSGTRFVAVMSLAAAVMGVSVSLLSQAASTLPAEVWLILPTASYLVTGFILYFSVVDVLRGYYLRVLEREFRHRTGMQDPPSPLEAPSWSHMLGAITSARRGIFGVRWAFGIGFLMFFSVLIAITVRGLDRAPLGAIRTIVGGFYLVNLAMRRPSRGAPRWDRSRFGAGS
jgi:hypothetical protein